MKHTLLCESSDWFVVLQTLFRNGPSKAHKAIGRDLGFQGSPFWFFSPFLVPLLDKFAHTTWFNTVSVPRHIPGVVKTTCGKDRNSVQLLLSLKKSSMVGATPSSPVANMVRCVLAEGRSPNTCTSNLAQAPADTIVSSVCHWDRILHGTAHLVTCQTAAQRWPKVAIMVIVVVSIRFRSARSSTATLLRGLASMVIVVVSIRCRSASQRGGRTLRTPGRLDCKTSAGQLQDTHTGRQGTYVSYKHAT